MYRIHSNSVPKTVTPIMYENVNAKKIKLLVNTLTGFRESMKAVEVFRVGTSVHACTCVQMYLCRRLCMYVCVCIGLPHFADGCLRACTSVLALAGGGDVVCSAIDSEMLAHKLTASFVHMFWLPK